MDDDETHKYLTTEETQYLGGTMERTHLVRGLDRALLSQVQRAAAAAPDAVAAPAAADAFPKHFATGLGRAVATALLKPPAATAAELFQPRRMAFVYFGDSGAASGSDDDDADGWFGPPADVLSLPETIQRAREECPPVPQGIMVGADAAILHEVVGVMNAIKLDGRKAGKNRKGKAGETAVGSCRLLDCSQGRSFRPCFVRAGATQNDDACGVSDGT